jgi:trigger factor
VKSTVEHLSPTRVRINVEVPFDELKSDFDRAYKNIAQQVKIPGFRPGKAPAKILEARIGRGPVLDEVVNNAIPTKYSEAVSEAEGVTPIGRPDIEVTEIADHERLAFTAEVDVRPEIQLPDLDAMTVEVDDVEVDDEAVDEQLDQLRARFGTLSGVERAATTGDYVQIDLSASVDGNEIEEATTTGFSYEIGQGGLIDGIDEALEGMSAGEEKTFQSTLVAGEYADREADITVKVTAVKERNLPEADDEFAQLASEYDTLDELTENLRERIGQSKRMEQATQARDRLLDQIVENTEVPLPESVVASEVESRTHDAVHAFDHDEERFAEFLTQQGQTREEFDAEARTEAEKAVRYRLVLDAIADSEEVSVGDQELTERIVFQAQQYGMAPEQFVQQIQQAGQLGAIYQDVRRSKALMTVVRAANVTLENGEAVDLSDLFGSEDDEDGSPDAAATGTVEGEVVEAGEAGEAAGATEDTEASTEDSEGSEGASDKADAKA